MFEVRASRREWLGLHLLSVVFVLLGVPCSSFAEIALRYAVAVEDVDPKVIQRAQALMPGSTFAYARSFDRPLLRAAAGSAGRFILVLGGRSIIVVGLDPAGDVLWEHRLATWSGHPTALPYPDYLTAAINGSALVWLGVDEDRGRYVVIDPTGKIVFDGTLDYPGDGGGALALSPCGNYFYERYQDAREITFHRVLGGSRHVTLPPWSEGSVPLSDGPTRVDFAFEDRALATTMFEGGMLRRTSVDLSVDPPALAEVETPPTADWHYYTAPLVGTVDGELLGYEAWDRTGTAHFACYGQDGRVRWRTPMGRRVGYPGRIIPAGDGHVAAFFAPPRYLKTIDTHSGRILDSAAVWQEHSNWWIGAVYEQWLEDGRLLMAIHGGGSGNEQAMAQVDIDAQGRIGASDLREEWVWGLGRRQPLLGVAQRCFADSICTIVGFRKKPTARGER